MENAFVIRPVQVEQSKEVNEISKSILTEPKFRICIGSPKNGKTALTYKLLLSLIKQGNFRLKAFFIGFDNVSIYDYWNKKISNNVTDQIVVASFKNIPFIYPLSNTSNNCPNISVQSRIEETISTGNYNLIIIDGFDWYFEVMSTDKINEFVKYLYKLVTNKGISVYLNSQEYYSCFEKIIINGKSQKWLLERPEYLGGDIVERGDTFLRIL